MKTTSIIDFDKFSILNVLKNFVITLFKKKYICERQHSEEDCGVACIATIIKNYGRFVSWQTIRRAIGTTQNGTNMLSLSRGANKLGFTAIPYNITVEWLDENFNQLTLPAIINWKGNHWVVLHGRTKTHYIIANPAFGIQYITNKDFKKYCQNYILLLEPNESFFTSTDETTKNTGFSSFFTRVLRSSHILVQVGLINGLLGVLSLSSPFLLQILTDDVLVRGDRQLLVSVTMAVGAMYIVSSSLGFVQAFLINHLGIKLQRGLNLEFFHKLIGLPLEFFNTHKSGEIVSRIEDTQQINSFVSQVVIGLPSQFFISLISLGLMFYYSTQLSFIALAIALFMSICPLLLLPKLKEVSYKLLEKSDEIQGMMIETFKGAETLKSISNSRHQIWEEFLINTNQLLNYSLAGSKIAIVNGTFSSLFSQLGSLTLLYLGSSFVINNELTIGMLIAFSSMSGNFTGFIRSLISYLDEYIQSKNALKRLSEINDNPREFQPYKEEVNINSEANITIEKLTYYYPGNINLFNNFQLKIPGGKSVALIGNSGCGKSTLGKLISGLYPPESGTIKYGEYDSKDIGLDSLREQVIIVPQEAHFWSKTIVENLRLGNRDLSFEEIVKACIITNAHEFIEKLPNGYHTVLSEFGTSLSGGQKQRLAIARAILNNPKLLIFDEATSNLDSINETNLFDKLLYFRNGKTTLIITHNPKIIKRVEHIIYLENGSVKAQGSYQELSNVIHQFIN